MKVLCVAEKPSIAKSISQILSGGRIQSRATQAQYIRNYDFAYRLSPPLGPAHGDTDFTVTSVLGHLTSQDFGEDHRKWHSCDPFSLFEANINTFVNDKLKDVAQNLKNEARTADVLMIWTDCDREGEHIGQEIVNVCRSVKPRIVVKRARFSAIIATQINHACQNPIELDVRQAEAVDARISLDLRIGAAFTRLQTMTLQARFPAHLDQKVISYGPCQFPTLGFVVDQYERIRAFAPEQFWYISVSLERDGSIVGFHWKRGHLFDFEIALVLYEQCVEQPLATVRSVRNTPTQRWKPLPLTTVDLQKSGSRLLHLAPKKVLDIAEKLYQQGFLSYPRTETDQFDKEFDFKALITKQVADHRWGPFSQRLLDGEFSIPRNGHKNDKAHPPIHPTAHAGALQGDEQRVYEFVTRRFLACCSKNATGDSTQIEVDIAGESFSASGVIIKARNYLDVYIYDKWSDSVLPDFQQGEQFMPSACEMKDGVTAAPALLTEADLVDLMDKNGIGTDATIAEHIAKIIEREYVEARQQGRTKYLFPSDLGIGLVDGYNRIGFDRSLSKPHLRRETEHRMQLICDGTVTKNQVLADSIQQYQEVYVRARREFETIVTSVDQYINGQRERDIRPPRPPGPGRGNGGGGGNGNQDDDDDDDDGRPGGDVPTRGRGRGRGRARGTTTERQSTRGRGTASGRGTGRSRKKAASTDGEEDVKEDTPPPAKKPRTSTSTEEIGPMCRCDDPAVKRTVVREGPNTGKAFWACPKGPGDASCGFFEWLLPESSNAAGPSNSQTRAPSDNRARPSGPGNRYRNSKKTVKCDCGDEAVERTVRKEGPNEGRVFYRCSKPSAEECKFFEWADDTDSGNTKTGALTRARPGSNQSYNSHDKVQTATSGDCYKCGKSGHWASKCESNEASTVATGAPKRKASSSSGRGRRKFG